MDLKFSYTDSLEEGSTSPPLNVARADLHMRQVLFMPVLDKNIHKAPETKKSPIWNKTTLLFSSFAWSKAEFSPWNTATLLMRADWSVKDRLSGVQLQMIATH